MEKKLNDQYWESRYLNGETGWDIGEISAPLLNFFLQLKDKNIRILIPGCGNAHEAAYLHQQGFKNVFLLDFAMSPLNNFKKEHPDFPTDHIIHDDFFKHQNTYDLIVEQTFFCALNPELRKQYVNHMSELLDSGAHLSGLLFHCEFENEGPPFGGSKEEYIQLFDEKFFIQKMEPCLHSISPRSGNELFIDLIRK